MANTTTNPFFATVLVAGMKNYDFITANEGRYTRVDGLSTEAAIECRGESPSIDSRHTTPCDTSMPEEHLGLYSKSDYHVRGSFSFGREGSADVVLPLPIAHGPKRRKIHNGISRMHFQVYLLASGIWMARPLHLNGIVVNGYHVDIGKECSLHPEQWNPIVLGANPITVWLRQFDPRTERICASIDRWYIPALDSVPGSRYCDLKSVQASSVSSQTSARMSSQVSSRLSSQTSSRISIATGTLLPHRKWVKMGNPLFENQKQYLEIEIVKGECRVRNENDGNQDDKIRFLSRLLRDLTLVNNLLTAGFLVHVLNMTQQSEFMVTRFMLESDEGSEMLVSFNDWVPGLPMDYFLRQSLLVRRAQLHRWFRDIIGALKHLEAKSIRHNDIRPGTIICLRNDRALLTGFSESTSNAEGPERSDVQDLSLAIAFGFVYHVSGKESESLSLPRAQSLLKKAGSEESDELINLISEGLSFGPHRSVDDLEATDRDLTGGFERPVFETLEAKRQFEITYESHGIKVRDLLRIVHSTNINLERAGVFLSSKGSTYCDRSMAAQLFRRYGFDEIAVQLSCERRPLIISARVSYHRPSRMVNITQMIGLVGDQREQICDRVPFPSKLQEVRGKQVWVGLYIPLHDFRLVLNEVPSIIVQRLDQLETPLDHSETLEKRFVGVDSHNFVQWVSDDRMNSQPVKRQESDQYRCDWSGVFDLTPGEGSSTERDPSESEIDELRFRFRQKRQGIREESREQPRRHRQ